MEWFFTDLLILLPFLIGVGLLVLEVFFPGFGIAGFSGLALEVLAIYFAYVHHGVTAALIVTAIAACVFGLVLFFSFRSATKGRLSRSALILKDEEKPVDSTAAPVVTQGAVGVTTTALRPTGMAEINGHRLEVMTEGDFIEKGETVRVIKVSGNKIIVG